MVYHYTDRYRQLEIRGGIYIFVTVTFYIDLVISLYNIRTYKGNKVVTKIFDLRF